MSDYQDFYNDKYANGEYGGKDGLTPEEKPSFPIIKAFVEKYCINNSKVKCLEIGSGKGTYQDIVDDYTGLDYSESVKKYYHKPFVSASADKMPFENDTFDYIWSYAVWEHIPQPEEALLETMRILKKKGVFLFAPAWHCRPWAANGYQVRPYSDFNLLGKIYKFMIPFLNSFAYRMVKLIVIRVFWMLVYVITPRDRFHLPYRKLKANYKKIWQSDSDACCDLDPFLTILWLRSKGYDIPSHSSFWRQLMSRNEAIEIKKV